MRFFKITLVISLLIGNISTYSQTTDKGLLLGLSGSQITGIQLSSTGIGVYNKLGLDLGGFVKHHINENWSIEGELKYIQKGYTDEIDNSRINLQYLEVPIYFTRNISTNFEAEFGIAAAYLIASNSYSVAYGSQPLTNPPGNYDYSAVAGFTYIYNEHFSFNLKLSYSIVPIDYYATYITWQNNYGRYNNVAELAVYYKL